jgi:hypothetical protein
MVDIPGLRDWEPDFNPYGPIGFPQGGYFDQ